MSAEKGDLGDVAERRTNTIAAEVFRDLSVELSESDADRVFLGIGDAINEGIRLGAAEAAAQVAEQGKTVRVDIVEE